MKATGIQFATKLCYSFALLLFVSSCSWSVASELGDRAPKLEVSDWYNGAPVQISDASNVCVVTFFESWCSSCMAALPQLNLCFERFKNHGVKFAGISVEPAETVKTFAEEQAKLKMLNFPVGADKQHATYDDYMDGFG